MTTAAEYAEIYKQKTETETEHSATLHVAAQMKIEEAQMFTEASEHTVDEMVAVIEAQDLKWREFSNMNIGINPEFWGEYVKDRNRILHKIWTERKAKAGATA